MSSTVITELLAQQGAMNKPKSSYPRTGYVLDRCACLSQYLRRGFKEHLYSAVAAVQADVTDIEGRRYHKI